MAWRTLTEDDVVTGLTGPETAAYKTAALKAGQSDPVAEIIEQVVNEVRSHIADCERNTLAAGVLIPERCILHAVAIIRFRLLTRLAVRATDEREQEYKDARRFLERVSECKVRIERPDGEVDSESNKPSIGVVSAPDRRMTHDKLKGL